MSNNKTRIPYVDTSFRVYYPYDDMHVLWIQTENTRLRISFLVLRIQNFWSISAKWARKLGFTVTFRQQMFTNEFYACAKSEFEFGIKNDICSLLFAIHTPVVTRIQTKLKIIQSMTAKYDLFGKKVTVENATSIGLTWPQRPK